jgi:uncharacterized membrane protein YdjX (TVP38/TMEM64 family)
VSGPGNIRSARLAGYRRVTAAFALAAVVAAAFWLDLAGYLRLEWLQASLHQLRGFVAARPATASLGFFFLYMTLAALSIPGAALVLTLAAGAIFGLIWGSILVSFASTIGGTLACVISRYLLRDLAERRFPYAVERVNRGLRMSGAYYLFGLRLVPVFPFFVVNTVMGLTRMPLLTFYWVSQLGLLPVIVIFVNAGTRLAEIRDLRGILAPEVLLSLALLGVFPLVARKLWTILIGRRRVRD